MTPIKYGQQQTTPRKALPKDITYQKTAVSNHKVNTVVHTLHVSWYTVQQEWRRLVNQCRISQIMNKLLRLPHILPSHNPTTALPPACTITHNVVKYWQLEVFYVLHKPHYQKTNTERLQSGSTILRLRRVDLRKRNDVCGASIQTRI